MGAVRVLLSNVVAYKDRLAKIETSVRAFIKSGRAVSGTTQWAINGSQKEGSKMVSDFCKLLLRAYNNEADDAVRTLKSFTRESSITRLSKARANIQALGSAMKIQISEEYHNLRVEELRLTADYLAKRDEEREQEKEARARLKEEEVVRRELEKAQEKLDKEHSHYEAVIQTLRANGDLVGLAKAEGKLLEIDSGLAGLAERAANIRTGYVYCISNEGAFGAGVVKIGLTRR